MELVGIFSGGAPVLKKLQISATVSDIGIPLLAAVSQEGGLNLPGADTAADGLGVNLDTATFVTAQQTDGSLAERTVTVVCNPDQMIRGLMTNGTTENTALALQVITADTSDGLDVTTGAEWSSPTFDEGVVWGFDNTNQGQFRKITSVSSTAGTVTVAFERDHLVGHNFLRAPYWIMGSKTASLSTLLTQFNAIVAVGTGGAFHCIDHFLGDLGDDGRNTSTVTVMFGDHFLSVGD